MSDAKSLDLSCGPDLAGNAHVFSHRKTLGRGHRYHGWSSSCQLVCLGCPHFHAQETQQEDTVELLFSRTSVEALIFIFFFGRKNNGKHQVFPSKVMISACFGSFVEQKCGSTTSELPFVGSDSNFRHQTWRVWLGLFDCVMHTIHVLVGHIFVVSYIFIWARYVSRDRTIGIAKPHGF